MGLCPLRLPTQVQLYCPGPPIWFAFFSLPFLECVIKSVLAPGIFLARAGSPFHGTVYFRGKIYNIKIIRFACVIRDSSTAQECADAVKPFLFSPVALVSYSYSAFMMSHSYDCLYEEEKLP